MQILSNDIVTIYSQTGLNDGVPANTTIAGAKTYTFNSDYEYSSGVLEIKVNDAEGGIRVGFNNEELRVLKDDDVATTTYTIKLPRIIKGTNTIHIWSVSGDRQSVKEIFVKVGVKQQIARSGKINRIIQKVQQLYNFYGTTTIEGVSNLPQIPKLVGKKTKIAKSKIDEVKSFVSSNFGSFTCHYDSETIINDEVLNQVYAKIKNYLPNQGCYVCDYYNTCSCDNTCNAFSCQCYIQRYGHATCYCNNSQHGYSCSCYNVSYGGTCDCFYATYDTCYCHYACYQDGVTRCQCNGTCDSVTTCSSGLYLCNCNGVCDTDNGCSCFFASDGDTCSCNSGCNSGYSTCSCDYTCYGYSVCSCNSRCYLYSGCSCNNTCHGYSTCSCNYTSYNSPCTCFLQCYGYSDCSCNNTCYSYSSCSCDNKCYRYSGCSCNNTCHGYSCTCNGSCNSGYSCMCNEQCYNDDSCFGYSDTICDCNGTTYTIGCDCNGNYMIDGCSCDGRCYVYDLTCGGGACYNYNKCSCDNECHGFICSCDIACYGYDPCDCDMKAYNYSCSCDYKCYSFSCQKCHSANYSCSSFTYNCSCDTACYAYEYCPTHNTCSNYSECQCYSICDNDQSNQVQTCSSYSECACYNLSDSSCYSDHVCSSDGTNSCPNNTGSDLCQSYCGTFTSQGSSQVTCSIDGLSCTVGG